MAIVHSLRALTVDLNLTATEFANTTGLHSTDVRALICLLDADRSDTVATPGWLGSQLGINSASVTALIDRMTRAGHVQREPDAVDRRRVRLRVTPAAVELGENFFGPLISRAANTLNSYTEDQRAVISKFLADMRHDVDDARSSQTPQRPNTLSP